MKTNEEHKEHSTVLDEIQRVDETLHSKPALLIITDIEDLIINYINPAVSFYCDVEPKMIYHKKIDFHRDLIHPDDFPNYLIHLHSCLELKDWESNEIIIRLRDKEGDWAKFCFKDRIYKSHLYGENNTVLSLAHKVEEEPVKPDETLCDKFSKENSNTKYYQLLNSIDEAYCLIEMIYNREGTPVDYLFRETNPAFRAQLNVEEPTGKTLQELMPGHQQHWVEAYGKVALSGEAMRFQEIEERGSKEWFELYAFRIGNDSSRRVAVLFQNITGRKRIEQNLRRSHGELEKKAAHSERELLENNELLQAVFDTTNLAIIVFETVYTPTGEIKDFLFKRVNKVLLEMYLEEDPLGTLYTETSRHGVNMGIFDAFKKVMRSGKMMDHEFFFDKEGYNNWFRIIANRQKNLLIVSIEDITARKAEAQKLKDVMRFNRQLVQTSPDTIIIVNLNEFNIRYINQDLHRRAGMTRKRILGMNLTEILPYIHPRDREKLITFHKDILKAGINEILDVEFRVKAQGTTWEWFQATGKIFDREEKDWINEYVLLVRNITEQKTTQQALINAERLSIQGEVARTFAHELRNPLASIRMATDVIKQKLDLTGQEKISNYLDILSRSTEVLNNLISNLLNASNYTPAILEKVDLAVCVEHALEHAADRIYLTGIKLIKKYSGPYYILADKEKLKIALLNIIVNASEATPPEEGVIELMIEEYKTDFILSITDNGHGLEEEQIAQLFDAFYTNKSTGLGIGLNSVKNILDEHDAQIEVLSKPGIGTTFKILFHNVEMV